MATEARCRKEIGMQPNAAHRNAFKEWRSHMTTITLRDGILTDMTLVTLVCRRMSLLYEVVNPGNFCFIFFNIGLVMTSLEPVDLLLALFPCFVIAWSPANKNNIPSSSSITHDRGLLLLQSLNGML
ncbi:hypothetical protein RIF29_14729 [Crotalaria pallida]|uniref:Uncharacterized protein n=1 Tax=Crotalaria pallida TaxID=3830 RepID=A0AAN9IIJ9_CROPI